MTLPNHRRLVCVAATLLLLFVAGGCAAQTDASEIAPEEVVARIEAGTAPLLLDVRTPAEFAGGHVPGAVNLPYDEVGQRSAELAAHRDQEVVVYCEKGPRAAKAAQALADAGFRSIRHLDGDMSGWRAAGLPVEKQP